MALKEKAAVGKKPVKKAAASVAGKAKAKPAAAKASANKSGLYTVSLKAPGGVSKWVVLSIEHQDAESISMTLKKPRSSTEVPMVISPSRVASFTFEKGEQVVYLFEEAYTYKIVEGSFAGVKNGFHQFKTADGIVQARAGNFKAVGAGIKGV